MHYDTRIPATRLKVPHVCAHVRDYARVHTLAAIDILVQIMHDPAAYPATRITAAKEILDRGWGRPESTTLDEYDRMDDAELLERSRALIASIDHARRDSSDD